LWAIAFATPFFVFFGWLSDRVGRKWIMMLGMLLGIVTYRPIFNTFLQDTNITEWKKENLTISGETQEKKVLAEGRSDFLAIKSTSYELNDGTGFTEVVTDTTFVDGTQTASASAQPTVAYKDKHLSQGTYWKFVGLVFLLILYVTMVYGPVAAFLVEIFPTKIRYTSMSLPYHIGNGVFGGLVPFIGLLLTTTYSKDPLVGLWYPIGIAALCLVIGSIYLSNKIDKEVSD
jgi:MFS family permease